MADQTEAAGTAVDRGVLTFKVGGERLALPTGDVAEILRPPAVTRVPHSPASLLGVTNLRGSVLPIVSLASLLGHKANPVSSATRIVVADKGTRVGLVVDEVSALSETATERQLDLGALLARDYGGLLRRATARRSARPDIQDTVVEAAARPELALIGFELAGQEYGLPLDSVVEVTAFPAEISALPRTDEAMVGVAAIRGGVLPLVSLRVLLGLPTEGFDRGKARILVIHFGGSLVGLVADGLKAILRVAEDSIDPVPPVLTRGKGEAQIESICRLDGGRRLISLLSPARLFDPETASRVQAHQGAAEMSTAETVHRETEQFVVFQLGGDHYGLPLAAIDEVVRRPDGLTRVPRAPAYMIGLMNLRGKAVPVIDQRQRFGFESDGNAKRGRVLVVTLDGLQAGFVVDTVSEVLRVATTELTAAPDLTATGAKVFDRIANIERDGRMILLIDAKELLSRAEKDVLAAIAAAAQAS